MAIDDLDTPLGLEKATKRRPTFSVPVSPLVAGGLGLFALAFVGSAMLVDNPFGGEPVVIVAADQSPDNPPRRKHSRPRPLPACARPSIPADTMGRG